MHRFLFILLLLTIPTSSFSGDIAVTNGKHAYDLRKPLTGFTKLNKSVSPRYTEWNAGFIYTDLVYPQDTDGTPDNMTDTNDVRTGIWDYRLYVVPPEGSKNGCAYAVVDCDPIAVINGVEYCTFGLTPPDWNSAAFEGAEIVTGGLTLQAVHCFNDGTNRAFWMGDDPHDEVDSLMATRGIADFFVNGVGATGAISVGASYAPMGISPTPYETSYAWDDIVYSLTVRKFESSSQNDRMLGRIDFSTETSINPVGLEYGHPRIDATIDCPTTSGAVACANQLSAMVRANNPLFNAWDTQAFLRMAADRYTEGWSPIEATSAETRGGYGLLHYSGELSSSHPFQGNYTNFLDIDDTHFEPYDLEQQPPVASLRQALYLGDGGRNCNDIEFVYAHFQQTIWNGTMIVQFEEDPTAHFNTAPDFTFWGLKHTIIEMNEDPSPGGYTFKHSAYIPEGEGSKDYWYAFFSYNYNGIPSRMVEPSTFGPFTWPDGGRVGGCSRPE